MIGLFGGFAEVVLDGLFAVSADILDFPILAGFDDLDVWGVVDAAGHEQDIALEIFS